MNLKELQANNNKITDLHGVQHLKYLNTLNLNNNKISDLTPLSGCIFLLSLQIQNNQILDLSPLKHNHFLQYLIMENNYISSIQPLSKLKNFKNFYFTLRNQVNPSLAQIQTSARMKSISTNISHLQNLEFYQINVQSHFSSVTYNIELLFDIIADVQLNLSNKLQQVFGTVEDASQ
ncbi:leucine-rich_repeat domain-containing protein [Hexamita inflata]|uniref:Leucine-rich repeat domain-containing protein n=1 Tax=Hexamita inflata TaxID=28002 RepID=A0AA86Q5V4_9EUKA|nr:leucine-rich repeat domain-containing protein [Hexamita inflata]